MFLLFHFVQNGKRNFLLACFLVFQALIFLWAFHNIINETYRIISPTMLNKSYLRTLHGKLEFFITCFTPYVWLVFSMNYANCKMKTNKKLLVALMIPQAYFYCLQFIGYFDAITEVKTRILFIIYITFCYAYTITGTILNIRYTLRASGSVRKQGVLVSFCILLPLISSFIQNYRVHILGKSYEVFGIDITLVSFSLTMIFAFAAFSRYRFLNVLPFAMKELYNSLEQPIIVLDSSNRILDYNKTFKEDLFDACQIEPDTDSGCLLKLLRDKMKDSDEKEQVIRAIDSQTHSFFSDEIIFNTPITKHYSVCIRPVFTNETDYIGRLILFIDITNLKKMIFDLNEKNLALEEYAIMAEELAVERERNRIAYDIHDTIGQSMTILNTILSRCIHSYDKDSTATKEELKTAVGVVKSGLTDLRHAVTGRAPEKLKPDNLIYSLENLIHDYTILGVKVALTVEGVVSRLPNDYFTFIYRFCQEALTNSVRHGKASKVSILIQILQENLRITLSDDGLGCKNIIKGYGLTGMELRAKNLNGNIQFENKEGTGFSIIAELPIVYAGKGDAV